EIRAFRIYDGPTEVHKWSLAKKIKREWKHAQEAAPAPKPKAAAKPRTSTPRKPAAKPKPPQ
ncbi:MAG: hypothetical protein EON88_17225, partial [Brevundimonas sp.]